MQHLEVSGAVRHIYMSLGGQRLKRSTPYRRTWWRRWRVMTSRSAFDHKIPTGIAVSVPKDATSKGMEANRNFSKWLSYGRGTSGNFG